MIRGFPKVLGSWWEIFENGDRGSTQNFAADVVSIVVWPGEPCLRKRQNFKKCILFENGHVQNFQKSSFFNKYVFLEIRRFLSKTASQGKPLCSRRPQRNSV